MEHKFSFFPLNKMKHFKKAALSREKISGLRKRGGKGAYRKKAAQFGPLQKQNSKAV
jgi:hypothetical protein